MKHIITTLIILILNLNLQAYNCLYDTPYSKELIKELQNIKFKKYDENILTYLFINRELRITLKLNPFAWFETCDHYDSDEIPIDYFNFKISWNF